MVRRWKGRTFRLRRRERVSGGDGGVAIGTRMKKVVSGQF